MKLLHFRDSKPLLLPTKCNDYENKVRRQLYFLICIMVTVGGMVRFSLFFETRSGGGGVPLTAYNAGWFGVLCLTPI